MLGVYGFCICKTSFMVYDFERADAVVYADTDSVKTLKDFTQYIEEDKQKVIDSIVESGMNRPQINVADFMPVDRKGRKEHQVFEFEKI